MHRVDFFKYCLLVRVAYIELYSDWILSLSNMICLTNFPNTMWLITLQCFFCVLEIVVCWFTFAVHRTYTSLEPTKCICFWYSHCVVDRDRLINMQRATWPLHGFNAQIAPISHNIYSLIHAVTIYKTAATPCAEHRAHALNGSVGCFMLYDDHLLQTQLKPQHKAVSIQFTFK